MWRHNKWPPPKNQEWGVFGLEEGCIIAKENFVIVTLYFSAVGLFLDVYGKFRIIN